MKKEVSRISIVGNGMLRNTKSMKEILDIVERNKLDMLQFDVSECKVSITFKNQISDTILNEIHEKLITE